MNCYYTTSYQKTSTLSIYFIHKQSYTGIMCGRYIIEIDEPALREIVDAAQRKLDERLKTGEIFPSDMVAVLIAGRSGMAALPMKWGMPKWDGKGVIINARQETAAQKKTFSRALAERRVAVPASGFFEWDNAGGSKKKYLFTDEERVPVYMAGIYNEYDGKPCFVILTTAANNSISPYHNRMPVLMRRDELRDWLKGDYNHILSRVPIELDAEPQE